MRQRRWGEALSAAAQTSTQPMPPCPWDRANQAGSAVFIPAPGPGQAPGSTHLDDAINNLRHGATPIQSEPSRGQQNRPIAGLKGCCPEQ